MSENTSEWSLFDNTDTVIDTPQTIQMNNTWRHTEVSMDNQQDEQVTINVRLLARLLRDMYPGSK